MCPFHSHALNLRFLFAPYSCRDILWRITCSGINRMTVMRTLSPKINNCAQCLCYVWYGTRGSLIGQVAVLSAVMTIQPVVVTRRERFHLDTSRPPCGRFITSKWYGREMEGRRPSCDHAPFRAQQGHKSPGRQYELSLLHFQNIYSRKSSVFVTLSLFQAMIMVFCVLAPCTLVGRC
jgi:hypothetical protein